MEEKLRMKKWVDIVMENRVLEESEMTKIAEYTCYYELGFITVIRPINNNILADIDKTKMSYLKVDATYPAVVGANQVFEETFCIINDQYNSKDFINIMVALCKKYDQDSTLIVFPPDDIEKKIEANIVAREYDENGNIVAEYKGFTVSAYDKYKDRNTKIKEYYSTPHSEPMTFKHIQLRAENINKAPEFDVLTYRHKKQGNLGGMREAQRKHYEVKNLLEYLYNKECEYYDRTKKRI